MSSFLSFSFHDTAPTDIYTLSLHDALPISLLATLAMAQRTRYTVTDLGTLGGTYSYAYGINNAGAVAGGSATLTQTGDRKSTRLNSSHLGISYAVFCLKKKKKTTRQRKSTR